MRRRRDWPTEVLCLFIAAIFATIVVLFVRDLDRQPAPDLRTSVEHSL